MIAPLFIVNVKDHNDKVYSSLSCETEAEAKKWFSFYKSNGQKVEVIKAR